MIWKIEKGNLQKFRQNMNLGGDAVPEERSSHRPQSHQLPYIKYIIGVQKILGSSYENFIILNTLLIYYVINY